MQKLIKILITALLIVIPLYPKFPSIKLPKEFAEIKKEDSVIKIYSAIPLYPEELKFKLENDSNSLIDKFNEFEIQEIVDIFRKNTCE